MANPAVGIGGRIAANPAIAALNVGAKVSTQISIDGVNTFMLTDVGSPTTAIAYQVGYRPALSDAWRKPGNVTFATLARATRRCRIA